MGINRVINTFKTGTYTVTRAGAGAYANGIFTPATPSTLPIDASVQPLNGFDLQVLDEAHHSENTKKLYTVTELFSKKDNQAADKISIDGEDYVVTNVKKIDFRGEVHYKVFATLVVEQ